MTPMLRRTVILTAVAISMGACGGDGPPTAATLADTVATTAAATTTSSSSTTSSSTSTSSTSSTTTTTEALPIPEPPPAPHANVAVVQIGTLEIPKIGVAKNMYEGVSLTVLNSGPGHWPGTAKPGHRGNAVIAGHRTSHDRPFRNIDQLLPGDQVIFTTDEGRFVYAVTGTEVVRPNALFIIDQSDGFTATLFACHPPGSTRQRIVVHLQLTTA